MWVRRCLRVDIRGHQVGGRCRGKMQRKVGDAMKLRLEGNNVWISLLSCATTVQLNSPFITYCNMLSGVYMRKTAITWKKSKRYADL